MTKEVLVSLKGLHAMQGENGEPVELISHGTYEEQNGFHMVQYEEVDEEDQEITRVTVIFSKEHVEIIKQGQNNAQMVFEENIKTTNNYETPYGELIVGIDTTLIEVKETEEEITILLGYGMDMNYNHVADCKVDIKITSKK